MLRSYKGLTLVELLFSALIVSFVLVGTVTIFTQTVRLSRMIDYEYIATNIAKSRLERARSIIDTSGFAALADMTEAETALGAGGKPDINGDFLRSTVVTTSHNDNARLTLVAVNVVYRIQGDWKKDAIISMVTIYTTVK